jgi:hypothetical protein
MYDGAQVIEKNRFLVMQNRSTRQRMTTSFTLDGKERARRRARLILLLMALAIAAATIAPVAVLAG